MRFLHISDLHLGKMLNGYDLSEDQQFILGEIGRIAEEEAVQGVLIAGDVYDKSNPSADAMGLFSGFVSALAIKRIPVYCISGNHDSAGRISYFSSLIREKGIYVTEQFEGTLQSYTVRDGFGELTIHLLPFVKPVTVRAFYPDESITNYEEAVAAVLAHSPIDPSKRNVLVCHQLITGSCKSGSEAMSVGGVENIPADLFDDFDYVAMGHIHGAQRAGRETMRYCGSPLAYDVSEAGRQKSVTIVDLLEKGDSDVRQIPLKPLRNVVAVKGKFHDLMQRERTDDFVGVIITDETVIPDARLLLRTVFPNMIAFGVENSVVKTEEVVNRQENMEEKSPLELFDEFFRQRNGENGMTPEQESIMRAIFEKAEAES